jgi:hypothetical protein
VFGIVDLLIAVGMGAFGPLFFADAIVGAGLTGAMSQLPLVLVPAFFVPVNIILLLPRCLRRVVSIEREGLETME